MINKVYDYLKDNIILPKDYKMNFKNDKICIGRTMKLDIDLSKELPKKYFNMEPFSIFWTDLEIKKVILLEDGCEFGRYNISWKSFIISCINKEQVLEECVKIFCKDKEYERMNRKQKLERVKNG